MKKLILVIAVIGGIHAISKAQVTLASSTPAIAAGTLPQGSSDNVIYRFQLTVATNPVILTAVTFNTVNTSPSDVTGYSVYYNTNNSLPGATLISARLTTTLGTGPHTITLSAPLGLAVSPNPYYFFIKCDVAAAGISKLGNTLNLAAITIADLIFSPPVPTTSGTASPGGIQTIIAALDTTARDVITNQIMLLNAANFDFSGQLSSNYIGHVNLYSPQPVPGWWKHLGFNAGIMKLNYSNNDTVQERDVIENIAISPLKKPKAGDKYMIQQNRYASRVKQTAWSFYVQPLIQLTNLESPQKVFLHGHLELFINKYTITNSYTTQRQDSAIVDTMTSVIRAVLNTQTIYHNNFVDGYFGGGLTFDLQPYKSAEFFLQFTFGMTTGKPSLSAFASPDANQRQIISSKKWYGFYMVRSTYIQRLSGMSTLVLGVDFRGFLPAYTPLVASYLGVNINVKDILKLIGI